MWGHLFDRLNLTGPAREAARLWMAGAPRLAVGVPLGLTHPSSVTNWARRVGLPGRYHRAGCRPAGALQHVGARVNNGRNFGRVRSA